MHTMAWCDTRHMFGGALAEGSVDRERVHAVMQGQLIIECPDKAWLGLQLRVPREADGLQDHRICLSSASAALM